MLFAHYGFFVCYSNIEFNSEKKSKRFCGHSLRWWWKRERKLHAEERREGGWNYFSVLATKCIFNCTLSCICLCDGGRLVSIFGTIHFAHLNDRYSRNSLENYYAHLLPSPVISIMLFYYFTAVFISSLFLFPSSHCS